MCIFEVSVYNSSDIAQEGKRKQWRLERKHKTVIPSSSNNSRKSKVAGRVPEHRQRELPARYTAKDPSANKVGYKVLGH